MDRRVSRFSRTARVLGAGTAGALLFGSVIAWTGVDSARAQEVKEGMRTFSVTPTTLQQKDTVTFGAKGLAVGQTVHFYLGDSETEIAAVTPTAIMWEQVTAEAEIGCDVKPGTYRIARSIDNAAIDSSRRVLKDVTLTVEANPECTSPAPVEPEPGEPDNGGGEDGADVTEPDSSTGTTTPEQPAEGEDKPVNEETTPTDPDTGDEADNDTTTPTDTVEPGEGEGENEVAPGGEETTEEGGTDTGKPGSDANPDTVKPGENTDSSGNDTVKPGENTDSSGNDTDKPGENTDSSGDDTAKPGEPNPGANEGSTTSPSAPEEKKPSAEAESTPGTATGETGGTHEEGASNEGNDGTGKGNAGAGHSETNAAPAGAQTLALTGASAGIVGLLGAALIAAGALALAIRRGARR